MLDVLDIYIRNEPSSGDKYILNDIIENGVKIANLQIVIFGILNIDRKYNDPVAMPYFSTNNLKSIRDQYITYLYYSQTDAYTYFIKEMNSIYDDPTNKTYEYKRKTLKFYLDTYKILLRDDHTLIQDAYNNLMAKSEESNFLSNLQVLIDRIEQANSLTVLGTMDYIDKLKNSFHTDLSCSMIDKDIGDNTTKSLALHLIIIIYRMFLYFQKMILFVIEM